MTLSRRILQQDSRPRLGSTRFTKHVTLWLGGPCRSPAALLNPAHHLSKATQLQSRIFLSQSVASVVPCPTFNLRTAASRIPLLTNVRAPALPIVASTTQQTRSHGGHSHAHHHHHHDNTYLVSSNKRDAGVRITRIGLYVNLGMAIVKGVGGWFFNSQALVADAFHALTDLVSDFMTLATISLSMKPPTVRFPGGFGKVESLGALGVSSLLLGGGVLMGWHACDILYTQLFLDAAAAAEHAAHGHGHGHGHGHSHAAADLIPNLNAAWLAAGSIVVKEWLYRATMKVARERKSSVLASNAMHHRVDSLTGFVAFIAIAGSHVLHGASWLDPVGGLIVSMMVIKAGWSNTTSALLELADIGVDDEIKGLVREAAVGSLVDNLDHVEVQSVQGVKSGQNYLMELELAVPGSWSVEQVRPMEQVIRGQVAKDVRGVKRLRIRFVPREAHLTDFGDEFISADLHAPPRTEHEHDKGR
ncbi:MAG: hypothetical protein M1837_002752 [Sclerophora amabilis]|nr:MAG: hypothetical protein M1837_002752 [Sclerophora amabilis]